MTHIVRVSYSKRGDWYIATSDDLRGLFVTNPSLSEVYQEIPEAIKLLFKAKYDMNVEVKETSLPEKRSIQELVYTAESLAA